MKNYLLLALPALAVAAPAAAQDAPTGGFRVEVLAGYDNVGVDEFEDEDDSVAQPTGNINGAVFGGGIGYDFAMGNVMLGVDAELTDSTADRGIFADTDELGIVRVATLKFDRDIYVGGRLTAAFTDQVRGYVKAGYTRQRVIVGSPIEEVEDAFDEEDIQTSGNLDGVRAGIGVQYSPDGNAYYGGEFRYSNYEADVDRKSFVFVVGYRF